jgi:hypothetical protein
MKTDYPGQVGATSRQLKRHRPSQTEADRRDPVRVDFSAPFERVEAALRAGPNVGHSGTQQLDDVHHFPQIADDPAAAV